MFQKWKSQFIEKPSFSIKKNLVDILSLSVEKRSFWIEEKLNWSAINWIYRIYFLFGLNECSDFYTNNELHNFYSAAGYTWDYMNTTHTLPHIANN